MDAAGPFRISPKVIVGVTIALSVFSTLQAYNYVSLFTDREPSFPMLLLLNTTFWFCWALLVPGIIWMARRFPLQRDTWIANAGVHIISVAVFVFLHALLTVTLRGPILSWMGREWSWWPAFQQLFFLNFDWEMMVYWGVGVERLRIDVHRDLQAIAEPRPLDRDVIRHGIAKKVEGGRVEISAKRDGNELSLTVRDTGPGISADKRSALSTGVGLTNTRSRLEHLFGERHRFEFHEPADGGLAVRIAIPFSVEPESHPAADTDMESVA